MNASDARKQAVAEQVSVHFDNHGRRSTGTKGAYAAEFMQTPEPGESASDVGNAA
jgi:hypothetical protein